MGSCPFGLLNELQLTRPPCLSGSNIRRVGSSKAQKKKKKGQKRQGLDQGDKRFLDSDVSSESSHWNRTSISSESALVEQRIYDLAISTYDSFGKWISNQALRLFAMYFYRVQQTVQRTTLLNLLVLPFWVLQFSSVFYSFCIRERVGLAAPSIRQSLLLPLPR